MRRRKCSNFEAGATDQRGLNSSSDAAASKRSRPGPVPLYKQHPELLTAVMAFVRQNGGQAEARRRTETVQAGVSAPQIREHIKQQLGLELCLSTVRRMFAAPHKAAKAAARYHNALDVKVPHKSNEGRAGGEDGHFSSAQCILLQELFARHRGAGLTQAKSCDTMNKAGTPVLQ